MTDISDSSTKLEEDGFYEPESVQAEKDKYMEDNNIIGHFIEDIFIREEGAVILRQEVYDAFKAWCRAPEHAEKEEKMSKRAFMQAMETIPGIEAVRTRIGGGGREENPRYCFNGLRFREEAKAETYRII